MHAHRRSSGKIAIYNKNGGVRALKLCDTELDTNSWLQWKGMSKSNVKLVYRPASRRRCEQYCSAAPFCNQYKEWLAKQTDSAPDEVAAAEIDNETEAQAYRDKMSGKRIN